MATEALVVAAVPAELPPAEAEPADADKSESEQEEDVQINSGAAVGRKALAIGSQDVSVLAISALEGVAGRTRRARCAQHEEESQWP